MGVLIERGIMRFLTDSPIVAQLVVTIGLMLGLMGLAASVWNPNTHAALIPTFFGSSGFHIGSTFLPYYRVVTIVTGIAVGCCSASCSTTRGSASRCARSSTTAT